MNVAVADDDYPDVADAKFHPLQKIWLRVLRMMIPGFQLRYDRIYTQQVHGVEDDPLRINHSIRSCLKGLIRCNKPNRSITYHRTWPYRRYEEHIMYVTARNQALQML